MTRVVVQRGGLSNQTPSRPPSNSASVTPSATASSSTTLPLSSQSPALSVPSSYTVLSSSLSLVSGDESPDIPGSEPQNFDGELYSSNLTGASVKNAAYAVPVDTRVTSEFEAAASRSQSACNLEIRREEAADEKEENLVRQAQHVSVVGKNLEASESYLNGTDSGRGINSDGEEQLKPFDTIRKEPLLEELSRSSEANSRKQPGRIFRGQLNSSARQNTASCNLTSHLVPSSMPLPSSTSHSPSNLQPVSHIPASLPPVHPPSAASCDTPPMSRTHEENDPGRPPSSFMTSDPVGCSYASAPIPLAPPAPLTPVSLRRSGWVGSSALSANRGPSSRRIPRGLKGTRSSPNSSRPTSPRSYGEGDGYNSADEQSPWTPGTSGYEDCMERERQFVIELRRVKGLEVRHMAEDGNCLFRAVADRVYGDAEMYDETRQMCIDYMEKERDHFSQFVTESFTAYCKRKRRDKVYGNNLEIQAMAEIYNRPIHIYSYSAEPINIFHGSYETDLPPIRLSYHRGNHYNAIVDPCNPAVGAGLGFGSLRGRNVDTEQVKAALNAQQELQIDKVLLAEGRYYSDMELTEQEIERMVIEESRAEYLAGEHRRIHNVWHEETSSSAGAEPSSSRTNCWNISRMEYQTVRTSDQYRNTLRLEN
nr:OTU domain-containing protein 5-B-like isoform X2 [Physcomitrium patens]|eukprot:XP_024380796.1 OTU domain-containing protein 5-B-like isoform X2 [Physcomitrella patens]